MSKGRTDTFAWETISSAMGDGLEDLIAMHGDEVGEDPFDFDWPRYQMLERAGAYRSISARRGRKLVGYASFFFNKSLHVRSLTVAANDALFIDPEARGRISIPFLNAIETMLREAGAQLLVQSDRKSCKVTQAKASATLGDLLLRRGFRLAERLYEKRL